MKTLKRAFIAFGRLLRANKITLLGDGSLIGIYYVLLEDLFNTYGFTFVDQPKEFYLTFALYTIGFIILTIAVNGRGLEKVEEFFSRINFRALSGIVDELIGLSIAVNADLVKSKLEKAYTLLDKVQPYIQEKQYDAIKQSLDNVNEELKRYEAKLELEREKKRQELLRIAQQELSSIEQTTTSQNNGDRRRL